MKMRNTPGSKKMKIPEKLGIGEGDKTKEIFGYLT
jgi:hypothetical protein